MATIPANIVIIWSGTTLNVPSGWLLCDGTNGTPDLRNRFVVGAGNTYALNATGGNKDAQLVSHSHSASTNTSSHTHAYVHNDSSPNSYTIDRTAAAALYTFTGEPLVTNNGSHTHDVSNTSSAGESGTNKNLPPYYALAYIMKGAE